MSRYLSKSMLSLLLTDGSELGFELVLHSRKPVSMIPHEGTWESGWQDEPEVNLVTQLVAEETHERNVLIIDWLVSSVANVCLVGVDPSLCLLETAQMQIQTLHFQSLFDERISTVPLANSPGANWLEGRLMNMEATRWLAWRRWLPSLGFIYSTRKYLLKPTNIIPQIVSLLSRSA